MPASGFTIQAIERTGTMHDWLPVSLYAGMVCFSIFGFIYFFLYAKYRERFLLLWTCAWAVYVVRTFVILLNALYGPAASLLVVEQMLVITTGIFLLWGTLRYLNAKLEDRFIAYTVPALLWPPLALAFGVQAPWLYLPTYFFIGFAQIFSGRAMLRQSSGSSIGGRVAGWSMVLWGIHNLDHPFLRHLQWFAPWGFMLGATLGLLVAVSVILAYMERLQEELAGSENRFRTIFRVNKAPFLLIDPHSGDIVDSSQGAVDLYGYGMEEMRGMNIESFCMLPPQEHAELRRGALTGEKPRFVSLHRLKNGETLAVEVFASPLEVAGRTLLFCIVQDITDRKRAQDLLTQANKTLTIVLDSVPADVNVVDAKSHEILFMNKAMRESLGRDCTGEPCHKAYRGREEVCGGCFMDGLCDPARDGEPHVWEDRNHFTGKWNMNHDRALRWIDGRMARIQVATDISERKIAEQAMAASLHEKEILLREIHHRVKNNLQIVASLLNLQEGHIENPEARKILAESQGRVLSMSHIHDQLYRSSDFSRIDVREYLGQFLPRLISTFRGHKDITLTIDSSEFSLPLDQAIPFGLILNELITNSLKHAFGGRDRGIIKVSASLQDGVVFLAVKDDGKGFEEDLQLEAATSLGLQIVNVLAAQLGGMLCIESSEWTSFNLRFPLQQLQPAQ
jgi:PAS domain S-box-containing protein